jgi:hypothetical protein
MPAAGSRGFPSHSPAKGFSLLGDAWEFLQRCTLSRLAAELRHEGELAVVA